MSFWRLEFESGGSFALGPGVVLVGRSASCDIVLDDPTISRRQLLLHPRPDGLELINVGRQSVTCNGIEVEEGGLAKAGDRVAVGGSPMAIVRAEQRPQGAAKWLLRVDDGPAIKIGHTPFSIGGGRDDLNIHAWPPGALRLHDVGRRLVAALGEGADALLEAGERAGFDEDGLAGLDVGTQLRVGGVGLRLAAMDGGAERSTCLEGEPAGGQVIRLERYARGGTLALEGDRAARLVYLAARRFALVHALFCPPAPERAGALICVAELCQRIWPGDPYKDETDFNVLLHRVRRDLLGAGIDADEVIERARGTGMVRARIAEGAAVIIE